RDLLGSDWAVSTTGVAGPDLQDGQPVGTVFVGVSGPAGTTSVQLALSGDRARIRADAVAGALAALASAVDADD
ncbi:MAG TPA: CinA family protein, partial [Marmoricola sp.]